MSRLPSPVLALLLVLELVVLASPFVLPCVVMAQNLQGNTLTINDVTGAHIRAPRLTQSQRDASTHNTGEIVYCTDCTPADLYVFDGTVWVPLGGGGGEGGGAPSGLHPGSVLFGSAAGAVASDPTGSIMWSDSLKRLKVARGVHTQADIGGQADGLFFSFLKPNDDSIGHQAGLFQIRSGNPSTGLVTIGNDHVALSAWAFRGPDGVAPIYGGNFGVVFQSPGVANGVEIDVQNNSGLNFQGQGLWINGSGLNHRSQAILIDTQDGTKWDNGIYFKEGHVPGGATGSIANKGIYFARSHSNDFIVIQPRDDASGVALKITKSDFSQNTVELAKEGILRGFGLGSSVGAPTFSFTDDPNTGMYTPAPDQLGFATGGVSRLILTDQGAFTSGPIVGPGLVSTGLAGVAIGPQAGGGVTGELRFLELATNGFNYVGFKAPPELGANNTVWTLPLVDGLPGEVLTTDGNRTLSFQPAGGGPGGGVAAGPADAIQRNAGAGVFGGSALATLNAAGAMALTAPPSIVVNNPNVGYWPAQVKTAFRLQTNTAEAGSDEAAATIIMHNTVASGLDLTTALAIGVSHEATGSASTSFGILTGVVLQATASNTSPIIGNRIAITNHLANRAGTTPVSIGVQLITQGAFSNTTGIQVSSSDASRWGEGILFTSTAIAPTTGVTIRDQGSPLRTLSIEGNPTFGIYQTSPVSNNWLAGGAILGPTNALPAPSVPGRVLFLTTDQRLYVDTGATWVAAGGAGGGHSIVDEAAAPLAQRGKLSFVGAGVEATDDAAGDRTIVTIPGSGTGSSLSGSTTLGGLAFWTSPTTIAGAEDIGTGEGLFWSGGVFRVPNVTSTHVPMVPIFPTGNPTISTLTTLTVQADTNPAGGRQFAGSFGLTSSHGGAGAFPDKVALYAGARGLLGTTDLWSLNTVLTQEAGSGTYQALGVEIDFNNLNAHRGDSDAGAGLSAPVSYGLAVTGNSAFRSTAALLIAGAVQTWNRGIVIANNSISATGSSFQDLTSPHKSIDIRGTPIWGIYQSSTAGTSNLLAGGAILGPVPTLPPPGLPGRVMYQSSDQRLYVDTGAVWAISGGGHLIRDADTATDFTQRPKLSFAGAGVTVSDNATLPGETIVTVQAGSATRYDVKAFGAVGNGTGNDATFIQAAITAACTASPPGGTVYLSPGRYRITTHINIPCGLIFEGAGWNDKATTGASALIAATATQDHIRVEADNQVIIRQLALRNEVLKTGGAGIRYVGYNNQTACFTKNPGARIADVMMGELTLGAAPIVPFREMWDGVSNGPVTPGGSGGGLCTAYMERASIYFQNRGVDMSDGEGGIDVVNSYVVGLIASSSIAVVNAAVTSSFLHSQGPATVLLANRPQVRTITSMFRSGSTVTVNTLQPHGYVDSGPNQSNVTISGVVPNGYNGAFNVASIHPTNQFQFTYTIGSTPGAVTTQGTVRQTTSLNEGATLKNNIIEGSANGVGVSIQLTNTHTNTTLITGNSIYGPRSGIVISAVGGSTNHTFQDFSITGNVIQIGGDVNGACLDINNSKEGAVTGNSCNTGGTLGTTTGVIVRADTSYLDFSSNQTGVNIDVPQDTTLVTSNVGLTSIRFPVYQLLNDTVFINATKSQHYHQIYLRGLQDSINGVNIRMVAPATGVNTPVKTIRVFDGNFEVIGGVGEADVSGNPIGYQYTMLRLQESIADGASTLWVRTNRGGVFELQRVKLGDPNSCSVGGVGHRCLVVNN